MNDSPEAERTALIGKLNATQPWLRFIGIMMMIGIVFMTIAAVGMTVVGILMTKGTIPAGTSSPGLLYSMGILYFVLTALYVFPTLQLLRSARHIRALATDSNNSSMVEALEHQRRFWKFCGIVTIVFLVIYALAFLAAIILPFIQGVQSAARAAH